jgi:heme/copper-type cytochrome/quinol oxidase subunit 2
MWSAQWPRIDSKLLSGEKYITLALTKSLLSGATGTRCLFPTDPNAVAAVITATSSIIVALLIIFIVDSVIVFLLQRYKNSGNIQHYFHYFFISLML